MSDNHTDRAEELGFDRVLQRLREVVTRLENGNLSLEESLRVYEEGVSLARRGHSLLDSAEKRVELLVQEGRGSGPRRCCPVFRLAFGRRRDRA